MTSLLLLLLLLYTVLAFHLLLLVCSLPRPAPHIECMSIHLPAYSRRRTPPLSDDECQRSGAATSTPAGAAFVDSQLQAERSRRGSQDISVGRSTPGSTKGNLGPSIAGSFKTAQHTRPGELVSPRWGVHGTIDAPLPTTVTTTMMMMMMMMMMTMTMLRRWS